MALTGKSTSLLFPHSLADAAAVASEGQWDNDGLAQDYFEQCKKKKCGKFMAQCF